MKLPAVVLFGILFLSNALAIVGGKPVQAKDPLARSVVGLYIEIAGASGGKYCSGILIRKNVVVTAAHCVPQETGIAVKVGFFIQPMQVLKQNNSEYIRTASKVKVHPKFLRAKSRWERKPYDVALVYLDTDAPRWAVPIKTIQSQNLMALPSKVLAIASGTDTQVDSNEPTLLRRAEFFVLKNVMEYFATLKIIVHPEDAMLPVIQAATSPTHTMFLVKNLDDIRLAEGDSGSPALVTLGGVTHVLGILSGPLSINDMDFGNYYVNLHEPAMNLWINSN